MTGREALRNGEKRLYDESVTPRNSPALGLIRNWGLGFLERILRGIGIAIDRGIDAIGVGKYLNFGEKQKSYTGYQTTVPAIASGYGVAPAKDAPTIIRMGDYRKRPADESWEGPVYWRCAA